MSAGAHYPVYLDLKARLCFVVGGCAMAEEKVKGLLAAGARVTVIAPDLTPGLSELAVEAKIDAIGRRYRRGDLRGAFLVIVVNQGQAVAEAVWEETRGKNVLVNTLDDVPHCDFIAPAIVRKGDLTVAISTGGKAPTLAVRLRQRLEAELGEEHARFLEIAGRLRAPLARLWPDFETRRSLWYRLVDSDVLHLLRRGEEAKALDRIEEIAGVRPEPAGLPAEVGA
ncbi:MAG TPA: bifunctional precorrin-2 dehydrogenase/sirohydrochlorin ferrochelatase [Thermoanaerobaculia bacterium]|jgi:siroheme synthase-like protein|nr:bifunctional precorrin-2 dehydrogenase/sirohydrochlorin ferrochelatase [Thermoanaerobaculia bacterium]